LSGYIMGERVEQATGIVKVDRLVILTQSAPRPSDALPPSMRVPPAPVVDIVPHDESEVPTELAPRVNQ